MRVFNSGESGYICQRCRVLINKDNMIVKKSKKGRDLHYCSQKCLLKHNAKS